MLDKADKKFHVLVADDSADDRFHLRAALMQTTRLHLVHEAVDGTEVIDYLKGSAGFGNRTRFPLPHLLLLDLKMPGLDGFEVLKWMRSSRVSQVTVVVLTGSMNPEHIKRALDLGADLFQVKPKNHHDRRNMVTAIEEHLVTSVSAVPAHVAAEILKRERPAIPGL